MYVYLMICMGLIVVAANSFVFSESSQQTAHPHPHPQPFNYRRKRTRVFNALGDMGKNFKIKLTEKMAGKYDQVAVKNLLDSYVQDSDDGVVMLTFENCPYCVKAREILNDRGIAFTDIKIDEMPENAALRCELGKAYEQTSVPAIFLKREFLGGCNNGGKGGLVPLIERGEFDKMMASQ